MKRSDLNFTIDNGLNITLYGITLNVTYGSLLNFELLMNDSYGNHDSYGGYSIEADEDTTNPTITEFFFGPDNETEESSYLFVRAIDSFGEIDRVLLTVQSPSGDITNFRLKYDNISK